MAAAVAAPLTPGAAAALATPLPPAIGTQLPAASAPPAACQLRGVTALLDPTINRGLATPAAVRLRYGLDGLLPAQVTQPNVEVQRAAAAVSRAEGSPLQQYQMLMALRERDQETFYSLVQQDVERYLPLIYTPTVGDACLAWGELLPRPSGLYVSLRDAGRVQALVDTWAQQQPQARIAVVTDGERILGLGDLGVHGMGIPVGKAAVYGACGVDPSWVLPITLDVGCDTASVVGDPLYVGLPQPRERGAPYYALVDELVAALQRRYGHGLLVHWEDVGGSHALPLLQRLGAGGVPTFNDDIQATAAITLASLLGAERLPGVPQLERQTFLFFGAGQANLGCAGLLAACLIARGLSAQQAMERIWLTDSRGLITQDREGLSEEKRRYAKPSPREGLGAGGADARSLEAVVRALRPGSLIGAATVGGAFTSGVLQAVAEVQPSASLRPVVFALSNPTSKAECSYQQALTATQGRAVFASGTQFPTARGARGQLLRPAQANNCYVFPGLGAGCVLSGAQRVTDGMLLAAAAAVAGLVSEADMAEDCVLPAVGRLRECATKVADAVVQAARADGVAFATAA